MLSVPVDHKLNGELPSQRRTSLTQIDRSLVVKSAAFLNDNDKFSSLTDLMKRLFGMIFSYEKCTILKLKHKSLQVFRENNAQLHLVASKSLNLQEFCKHIEWSF